MNCRRTLFLPARPALRARGALMKPITPRWILFAAVAAVPLFGLASGAAAQYRVNTAGRALDANNRIGSGGQNPADGANRTGNMVSGNDIVLGNVTGGKQFRGGVPYSDPTEFRGFTASRA